MARGGHTGRSIGGGGTYRWGGTGSKLLKPDIRIIGVEAAGCPMMWTSRQQQKIVKLENVKRCSHPCGTFNEAINFALAERYMNEIVLVPEDR